MPIIVPTLPNTETNLASQQQTATPAAFSCFFACSPITRTCAPKPFASVNALISLSLSVLSPLLLTIRYHYPFAAAENSSEKLSAIVWGSHTNIAPLSELKSTHGIMRCFSDPLKAYPDRCLDPLDRPTPICTQPIYHQHHHKYSHSFTAPIIPLSLSCCSVHPFDRLSHYLLCLLLTCMLLFLFFEGNLYGSYLGHSTL